MINFPFEVGVLGWASTLIFWATLIVIVIGIIKLKSNMKNVFYNSWVAKTALCLSKCHTIMLFGFVFSKLKEEEVTQRVRNHECVHARQWFEVTALSGSVLLAIVLVFGISPWWMLLSGGIYYVWYVLEWVCKSVWYSVMIDEWTCDMETPYQSISFEREARLSERDSNYLENGGYFGWLKKL